MRTAPNYQLGLALVCCSVLLVSAAQLLLKNAAMHTDGLRNLGVIVAQMQLKILGPFIGGLLCYGISMLIWQRALGELPLSIAYPLLSLSYPLVYLATLLLPGFIETINPQRIGGLIFVLIGVALLAPRKNDSPVRSTDNNEY
jgi:undecaprenyl phosphate-alpha-L-ara4N flippase subunit ArnF